ELLQPPDHLVPARRWRRKLVVPQRLHAAAVGVSGPELDQRHLVAGYLNRVDVSRDDTVAARGDPGIHGDELVPTAHRRTAHRSSSVVADDVLVEGRGQRVGIAA